MAGLSGNSAGRRRPPVTILARAPERGRVKTRLARDLGEDAALELHEALLLDVIARLSEWGQEGLSLSLAMTGSDEAMRRGRALVEGLPLALETQCAGDLGARIEEALARRAGETGGPSLVVGSDCPFLTDALLDAAAALANRDATDAVVVPARDGGFVLLGAPALPGGTLAGIDWGSARVLGQTRAALRAAGLSCAVAAEPEGDLDELADLPAALARLEAAPGMAPRTLRFLRARAGLPPAG